MFKKPDATTVAYAAQASFLMATASPFILASAVKRKVQDHPLATSIVCGAGASVVIGLALIDGDKAHPNSRYAKTFNK